MRLEFDRISDALEQNLKLPEVATKAPPVGRAAPCQSYDWLGALNRPIKIQSLMYKHSLALRARMIKVVKAFYQIRRKQASEFESLLLIPAERRLNL